MIVAKLVLGLLGLISGGILGSWIVFEYVWPWQASISLALGG